MPTFNERENIANLVEAVFRACPGISVLVIDDSSPDGTAEVVRALQARYPNLRILERSHNPGFGYSYRDGFRQAISDPQCRAVVMMDSDFSHDPVVVPRLVDGLSEFDAAVGSRYIKGGSVKNWNLPRRMLSGAANLFAHVMLQLPVRDATAGFIALRRSALEAIPYDDMYSQGYAFLVELKFLLKRSHQRITEFPIRFDERREGRSKMSVGKMWESFVLLCKIRLGIRHSAAARVRLPETSR